ncbi:MAG: T9SS type A sorting domain-containing protein [Bacteroidota bacterium]|nr:T9SS type A sorting domain-containing protein [Bacteroidota bacterium]
MKFSKVKRVFTITFMVCFTHTGFSQIASWSWASAPANYNQTGALSNITASALTVSSGTISYISGSSSVSVSSWSTAGTFSTSTKYWQLSITPDANYQTSVSSFAFDAGRSATGPQSITVQYSLDAFATAGTTILNGAANSNTSTLSSISANSNLPVSATTGTITFRIWGYGATSTGNFRINNIAIGGTTSASGGITNFYLKTSGYCNDLNSWTDDSTLSAGNAPANFSALNQMFHVVNQSNATIGAGWLVSGSGSGIIIGDSLHPTDFLIPDSFAVNCSNGIYVSANSTLTINHTTIPNFSYVSLLSSIVYGAGSGVQNITQTSYGNLSLSGSGTRVFPSGIINIYGIFNPGSFTAALSGTIHFAGGNGQSIPAFIYNNLSSDNYSRTLANGVIGLTGTFTPGSGNYTIGTSTIDFCGSSSQTIPVLAVGSGAHYYNLRYSGDSKATLADSIFVANDVTVSSGVVALTNSTRKVLAIGGNLNLTGGTLDFASTSASASGEVQLRGNLVQTALFGTLTTANTGNGTLYFCGTGTINSPQTFSLNTISCLNYTNICINSGTAVRLLSNLLLRRESAANTSYQGTLTVHGILDADIYTFNGGINSTSINTNANFILNSGASLYTSNTDGINTSIGTTNLSRTFNAGASYVFNAATSSAFPTFVQAASFGNPANVTANYSISTNRPLTITGILAIANSSIVTLGANALTVNQISGNGSLAVTNNSSISITGRPNVSPVSGDNTLYFDPNNNTMGTFTIGDGTNPATATIGSNLNIKPGGELRFGVLGNSVLFTANKLTLKSDSLATASLGNTHQSLITGNINIERYINSNTRRNRFVGFPFSSGVNLLDYRDDVWITGPGTGSGPLNAANYNSNGFHYSQANDTSVFYFNESKNASSSGSRWEGVTNCTQSLVAGTGYRFYFRGPVSQGTVCIDGSKPAPQSAILLAGGLVKTGTQNFAVSCSNGCLNVAGTQAINTDDGWNLIANPYPSAIDWNAASGWTKTNMKDIIWIWNPGIGSYGNFDGLTQTNNVSGIIASGQAFFVRANGSNPALACTEAVKVNSNPSNLFKAKKTNYLSIKLVYDQANNDECVIRFLENKSDSFNANEDILKLMNANINIYLIPEQNRKVSINYLNDFDPTKSYSIKLGIKAVKASYQLSFQELNSFADTQIVLKDNYLNTIIDLLQNQNYFFEVNADSLSQGEGRFELLFNEVATKILEKASSESKWALVYPNPVKDLLNLQLLKPNTSFTYRLFNIMGQEMESGKIFESHTSISTLHLKPGLYFISLFDPKSSSQLIKFFKY